MNKFYLCFLVVTICIFASCSYTGKNNNDGFVGRLHTPNEKPNWYRVLGETTIEKHWKYFEEIDWEKEYWEEHESGNEYPTFLEVWDSINNVHLSVSTSPLDKDSFQFSIWVGVRSVFDVKGKEVEEGFVECYWLNSNDSKKVKALMDIFFKRNYDLFFEELYKLEFRFKIEDRCYDIN